MPAVCRHNDTGLGWDRSLKQRQGWTFGAFGHGDGVLGHGERVSRGKYSTSLIVAMYLHFLVE